MELPVLQLSDWEILPDGALRGRRGKLSRHSRVLLPLHRCLVVVGVVAGQTCVKDMRRFSTC
jgi:hypothetical protein